MASFMFDVAAEDLLEGTSNWESVNFGYLLCGVGNNCSSNKTAATVSALTLDEPDHASYTGAGTSGSFTLTPKTVTVAGNIITFDSTSSPSYASLTLGTPATVVATLIYIYPTAIRTFTDAIPTFYHEFSTPQAPNGTTFSWEWPTTGIFRFGDKANISG